VSCREQLLGRRDFLPSKMATDARRPVKKAFPNVALALTDAWPHYEADMIRLSPLGSVADILANHAITLTNDSHLFTLFRWGSGRHLQCGHLSRGSSARNWESLDRGSLVARAHPGLSDWRSPRITHGTQSLSSFGVSRILYVSSVLLARGVTETEGVERVPA